MEKFVHSSRLGELRSQILAALGDRLGSCSSRAAFSTAIAQELLIRQVAAAQRRDYRKTAKEIRSVLRAAEKAARAIEGLQKVSNSLLASRVSAETWMQLGNKVAFIELDEVKAYLSALSVNSSKVLKSTGRRGPNDAAEVYLAGWLAEEYYRYFLKLPCTARGGLNFNRAGTAKKRETPFDRVCSVVGVWTYGQEEGISLSARQKATQRLQRERDSFKSIVRQVPQKKASN